MSRMQALKKKYAKTDHADSLKASLSVEQSPAIARHTEPPLSNRTIGDHDALKVELLQDHNTHRAIVDNREDLQIAIRRLEEELKLLKQNEIRLQSELMEQQRTAQDAEVQRERQAETARELQHRLTNEAQDAVQHEREKWQVTAAFA